MKKTETRSPAECLLDRAIELTFPASDPIAVEHAFGVARERDQVRAGKLQPRRARGSGPGNARPARKRRD